MSIDIFSRMVLRLLLGNDPGSMMAKQSVLFVMCFETANPRGTIILNGLGEKGSPSPSMSTVSCPEYPELQEKLHRLAMARDSLSLQVTILTEQVGAQKEKIRDLENLLATKANNLDSTEELLQERVDSNGDLESKKLDLLAEVSNLKLKYATLEKEKMETERKLQLSQVC
uniref:Liprin-beta-2-like n=1 Tax=Elaeophora elaphi TaxID=1147741 RepID=A0A0R3RN66_9BILA